MTFRETPAGILRGAVTPIQTQLRNRYLRNKRLDRFVARGRRFGVGIAPVGKESVEVGGDVAVVSQDRIGAAQRRGGGVAGRPTACDQYPTA